MTPRTSYKACVSAGSRLRPMPPMPPGMSPSMPKGMPPPPKNIFSSSQASSSPSSNDAPAPAWRRVARRRRRVASDASTAVDALSRSAVRSVRLSFEICAGWSRCVYASAAALRWSGARVRAGGPPARPRTRCSPDPRKRGYSGPVGCSRREIRSRTALVCSDRVVSMHWWPHLSRRVSLITSRERRRTRDLEALVTLSLAGTIPPIQNKGSYRSSRGRRVGTSGRKRGRQNARLVVGPSA